MAVQRNVTEKVEKVPEDLNGMKLYKILTSDDTWHDLISDYQYFVMQTSSRSSDYGKQMVNKS